jgi:hypothetical protein
MHIRAFCRLGEFVLSSLEVGIGPSELALFHELDLVVGRGGYLIFQQPAACPMADRKALDPLLGQCMILGDVLALSVTPHLVMTGVQFIQHGGGRWCGLLAVRCCRHESQQCGLNLGIERDGLQCLVRFDSQVFPSIDRKRVASFGNLGTGNANIDIVLVQRECPEDW